MSETLERVSLERVWLSILTSPPVAQTWAAIWTDGRQVVLRMEPTRAGAVEAATQIGRLNAGGVTFISRVSPPGKKAEIYHNPDYGGYYALRYAPCGQPDATTSPSATQTTQRTSSSSRSARRRAKRETRRSRCSSSS